MADKKIEEIILILKGIKEDNTVPKNIKERLEQAISTLSKSDFDEPIRIDQALEELDLVSDDPNTPMYTRLEVLNIISALGSRI